MSKVTSDFLSSIKGASGQNIYRTIPEAIIMYPKPTTAPRFENEDDREARDLRADQFGGVNALVPFVIDAAKLGFPAKERNQSAANMFVRRNSGVVVTSAPDGSGGFTQEYNFRDMTLSAGPLETPTVTATVDPEARTVGFTITAMAEDEETSVCHATDAVYGFVFDGETKRGRVVELGTRGDGGAKAFAIPAKWATTDLYVYAFARARKGRKASPTLLLYPAE